MIFLEYVGSRACLSAEKNCKTKKEGVSKCTPSLFYVQSPDFHKLGLCYYLKILYL